MTGELKYTIFKSVIGWLQILASPTGLLRISLSNHPDNTAYKTSGNGIHAATHSPHHFNELVERLNKYLSGQEVVFNDKLDLSDATVFQRQVWETTRLIPYGETRSYRWIAEQMKRPQAARAVGQALSRNPLLIIIPCHRVIASNGSLGGFKGGLETKKQLLKIEKSSRVSNKMLPG
jgi:methylated-DNA-[protein]-cysteine S-methyltransferase